MFKVEEPIGWNIKIEPVDPKYLLEFGLYELYYIESYPNDELHMKSIKATKDLISQHPMFANNVEIVEKDRTIELHFKYRGIKQTLIDMITGEFLSFSSLGKKTFQDLFVNFFLDECAAVSKGSHGVLYGKSNGVTEAVK